MNWNAKDYNEISLNCIWSEHVEKEAKQIRKGIKTTYTCNPCSSLELNNGLGSRRLDPIEIGDDPDVQRVVKGLLDASRLPQEKYQEPATSAQEVGWFHEPLVVANPRFVHKIHQGEVTKFAEVYTKKMAGAHMFHGSSGKYLKF
eukprot:jgi/Chrpa1/18681/Chrysochromulina_OHIO_Genome00018495-RA